MGSEQRYISNELTHFAGVHEKDKNSQYQILTKILKDGHLRPKQWPPKVQRNLAQGVKLSSNKLYLSDVVCFCDIPVQDLRIHTSKYTVFGLSFEKDFVVRQGVVPVYYIPKKAKNCLKCHSDIEEAFDEIHDRLMRIRKSLDDKLRSLLYVYFFSHLKFFDHNLEDDDKANYYFEREWRLFGELKFKVEENVKRVLIPKCYAKTFRLDFPKYHGQISFLE